MTAMTWGLVVLGILLSSCGGILLKMGAADIRYSEGPLPVAWQLASSWKIVGGMLMYFVPVLIWIFLLKRLDLSFLQPLFSLVYVVTPIMAMLLLHEQVPAARWLGIGVVMLGVLIIASSQ